MSKDSGRIVRIRHAYNMKSRPIQEYNVTCPASDLVFISGLIQQYTSILDKYRKDIQYLAYYRNKFLSIAKNLAKAKELGTHEISCAYGSLVLVICMLRDENIWAGTEYADNSNFSRIAENLSFQIGYDYDAAIEKCRKKAEKEDANSDVGDEAMALMVKKAKREAEYQKKKKEEKERAKK